MQSYQLTLKPLTAFATPMLGDTLFGQLCWAVRNRFGEGRLEELLQDYSETPFAVVSDAFPEGHVPLPKLPGCYYREVPKMDRKAVKKRSWLPLSALRSELPEWLDLAKTDADIAAGFQDKKKHSLMETHSQPHNSINRLTGTTGEGFAPYTMDQNWFHPQLQWHCYVLVDESRIESDEIRQCLDDIGLLGYGRDASIGMGKFEVRQFQSFQFPDRDDANSFLTLAACAPQGLDFDPARSFYQVFTRFGRHGDRAVHKDNKPFKSPVLLAKAGAVLTARFPVDNWLGQGIGGSGELSKTIPQTVQQGYAPVIAIHLPEAV